MHSSAYKRDSKDEVMRKILHGRSPYKHIDRQTHYLHNVQRELDARQSKKNIQCTQRRNSTTSKKSKQLYRTSQTYGYAV